MKPSRFPLVLVSLTVALTASSAISAEQPASSDAPLVAEPASSDAPLVAEEVRQLMQDQNYAEAVKAIEKASKAENAPVDYLSYL
ncbi:MAG TPA: hypothetical protein VMY42_11570, partial [Thermoguttaceae bacterium]|nr:hypothetical protein [Thermoguttaceae bacterium]